MILKVEMTWLWKLSEPFESQIKGPNPVSMFAVITHTYNAGQFRIHDDYDLRSIVFSLFIFLPNRWIGRFPAALSSKSFQNNRHFCHMALRECSHAAIPVHNETLWRENKPRQVFLMWCRTIKIKILKTDSADYAFLSGDEQSRVLGLCITTFWRLSIAQYLYQHQVESSQQHTSK